MNKQQIINELVDITKKKAITFSESYYLSKDGKTIMGEMPFKEILFWPYRDTEAGSNPREYYGIQHTNMKILQSLLMDNEHLFRFLHSGLIISVTSSKFPTSNGNKIQYDECCLTNGNQSRFIILITTILKLFFAEDDITEINKDLKKRYLSFIKTSFQHSPETYEFINSIDIKKINGFIRYLRENSKYLTNFNKVDIYRFLSTKIRVQVNIINSIVKDLGNDLNETATGTLIAEANNDTRTVKPDDLFGNKYQKELKNILFKNFISENPKISIEYRYGEITESSKDKIHILFLLRPIIATGLLTREKEIFDLTNKREPTYKIFEKLLKRTDKAKETISITSKLIPLLYKYRIDYIIPTLESKKGELFREYKNKLHAGEFDNPQINQEFEKIKDDEKSVDKLVRGFIRYSIEHIMPVIIYRIRKLFLEKNNNIILSIPREVELKFFETILEDVYENYVYLKISTPYFSSYIRSKDYYNLGAGSYKAFLKLEEIQETNFIESKRYFLT
ncbi:MAG: hypothetical protein O6940_03595 [Ignavibacteria bacterium]|nr:hypothetical protein [Ignavibacteria bacterium]